MRLPPPNIRFFDAIVYFRPRYLHWKRLRPSESWQTLFRMTIFTTEAPTRRSGEAGMVQRSSDDRSYDTTADPPGGRSTTQDDTSSVVNHTATKARDDYARQAQSTSLDFFEVPPALDTQPVGEDSEERKQPEEELG